MIVTDCQQEPGVANEKEESGCREMWVEVLGKYQPEASPIAGFAGVIKEVFEEIKQIRWRLIYRQNTVLR